MANHYYVFTSYNVRVTTYFLVTKNSVNNFLKQHQKPFTLEKRIKLLRIEMIPQKIYSDSIADSNLIGFIKT